jgi:hypothetical protein
MKYSYILASALSLSLLTGCGSKLSKLTDEQKSTVKGTLNSAERSFKATNSATAAKGAGREFAKEYPQADSLFVSPTALLTRNSPALPSSPEIPNSPAGDQKLHDLENRLHKGLADGTCKTYEGNERDTGISIPAGKYHVSLSGPSCPLTFDFKYELNPQSREFSMHVEFAVQDDDMKKLTELHKFNADGSAKLEENSASVKLDAFLATVKYGEVKIAAKGSASSDRKSSKGDLTIRLDYEKFAAEFEFKMKNEEVKIYLNGEELTPEQFKEYIQKLPGVTKG